MQALNGSYPYVAAEYSFLVRILLLFSGIKLDIPVFEFFSEERNTVAVGGRKKYHSAFLIHGFIRKYIEYRGGIFTYTRYGNLLLAVLISFMIILIFGNRYVGSILRLICTGKGVELLCQKAFKRK